MLTARYTSSNQPQHHKPPPQPAGNAQRAFLMPWRIRVPRKPLWLYARAFIPRPFSVHYIILYFQIQSKRAKKRGGEEESPNPACSWARTANCCKCNTLSEASGTAERLIAIDSQQVFTISKRSTRCLDRCHDTSVVQIDERLLQMQQKMAPTVVLIINK